MLGWLMPYEHRVGSNRDDDLSLWNDFRDYLVDDEEVNLMMLIFPPLLPSFLLPVSILS